MEKSVLNYCHIRTSNSVAQALSRCDCEKEDTQNVDVWKIYGLSETDLGPSASVLQCLYLGKCLLDQQNTKKPYWTKNSCLHAAVLANSVLKDTKSPKNPKLPLLKNQEQKPDIGSKSRVLYTPHALNTPKDWAEHLSHPSDLTPGHTRTLTPCKEPAYPSTLGSKQGSLLFVFPPFCSWSSSPRKTLPEFLVWSLVNFCWFGEGQEPWSVS